jgi:hypothetical protein
VSRRSAEGAKADHLAEAARVSARSLRFDSRRLGERSESNGTIAYCIGRIR